MSDEQLLADLQSRGYRFAERWHTSEVLEFVRRELSRPAWPLYVVYTVLGGLLVIALALGGGAFVDGRAIVSDVLVPFGVGVLAIILLIVPHELLHGLAFKLLGAPKVTYGADWSKLVFHAAAPGFPIERRGMVLVALAPFVIITTALAIPGVLLGGFYSWVALGALLMHTQGCLGDFAMLNFFARAASGYAYVTYDESNGESFVFVIRQEA